MVVSWLRNLDIRISHISPPEIPCCLPDVAPKEWLYESPGLLRNHKRKNAENVPALILACGMVFIGISLTLEEAMLLRDSKHYPM